MLNQHQWAMGIALCLCVSVAQDAHAQNPLGTRVNWTGAAGSPLDWDAGDGGGGQGDFWDGPDGAYQPDGTLGEYASVSNGGVAVINSSIISHPVDIFLGEDSSSTGTLVVRDAGSIQVASAQVLGEATGNGALRVGANGVGTLVLHDNMGAVSVQNYEQTGLSTLVAKLSGGGTFANRVTASESISLSGGLVVEQAPGSAYTLNLGDAWTVIDGAEVSGGFISVSVDASLMSNAGQTIVTSTEGNAVSLSVQQRLMMNVDRFTGELILENPSGHSTTFELISYTLSASAGNLDSADSAWHSLADSSSAWAEANPSSTSLSELSPSGSLVLAPGESVNLGFPVSQRANPSFGQDLVDTAGLTMRVQATTGELMIAPGLEVGGRYNDMVLVVEDDGTAYIQNQSIQGVEFIGYTISSESGSLLTSFNSLDDQNLPGWAEANPTSMNVSELNADDSANLTAGHDLGLGTLWNAATGVKDLTFTYQGLDGELYTGLVQYGEKIDYAAGLTGDYNNDGTVDAADYAVWRNKLGSTDVLPNDPIGGQVSQAQYDQWRSHFGESSGAPAPTASPVSTPEPSSAILLLSAFGLLTRRRKAWAVVAGRKPSPA